MVVRMDGALLPERMAQDLVRTIRDHLVRIHVRRGPAAGLEDAQREMAVQFAVHHLWARWDARLADFVVEQSELHVRLGARHLDQAESVDEPPAEADSADWEVFDRSLSLDSPVCVLWDFDLPQEVFLDAELRHLNAPPCRQSPGSINIANEFVHTNGSDRPIPTTVCPDCGSEHLVRDYARGELVCDSCGVVISEGAIDEGPEWSAYSVEENDRLARTGAPRSYVAGASGLTTVIPLANKDARGNTIPLREREKFYRMRKLQRHSGHSRPGERSLPETIRSLDRVASLMGLPRPVKDEAGFICKKALEKGLVRGRSIEAIVAAAVYAACRIDGVPRTLDELQQVTGVRKKTIGKAYGALLRTLVLRVPPSRPTNYVSGFCSRLGLDRV